MHDSLLGIPRGAAMPEDADVRARIQTGIASPPDRPRRCVRQEAILHAMRAYGLDRAQGNA